MLFLFTSSHLLLIRLIMALVVFLNDRLFIYFFLKNFSKDTEKQFFRKRITLYRIKKNCFQNRRAVTSDARFDISGQTMSEKFMILIKVCGKKTVLIKNAHIRCYLFYLKLYIGMLKSNKRQVFLRHSDQICQQLSEFH